MKRQAKRRVKIVKNCKLDILTMQYLHFVDNQKQPQANASSSTTFPTLLPI